MPKLLIAGAGGAPSEGVINSLQKNSDNEVIGMGSEVSDLVLSAASRKYYVPYANDPKYKGALLKILSKEKPDLVHFQNDLEIYHASLLRNDILKTGTKIFMPEHEVIDTCVHKDKSYEAFSSAGIKVPKNLLIETPDDLARAFEELADEDGKIWLRASSIGGGGKGSIPTNSFDMASSWISHYQGWGDFLAAEMLTADTVAWMSIWYEGELVVAQTRERRGWTHGNRSISGVTGVTKVGVTVANDLVDDVALASVRAVSSKPHGIFGVDMTYDKQCIPNPTEINISRFFTTVRFFTEAGLNMPEIFKELALFGKSSIVPDQNLNPLENGLMWMRGMDTSPLLIHEDKLSDHVVFLE